MAIQAGFIPESVNFDNAILVFGADQINLKMNQTSVHYSEKTKEYKTAEFGDTVADERTTGYEMYAEAEVENKDLATLALILGTTVDESVAGKKTIKGGVSGLGGSLYTRAQVCTIHPIDNNTDTSQDIGFYKGAIKITGEFNYGDESGDTGVKIRIVAFPDRTRPKDDCLYFIGDKPV